MSLPSPIAERRLAGPTATARSLELAGAMTVLAILALGVTGFWLAPLAFLAAGAGAGYSLSGSV